jgi:antitoxin component YwqK of YwqJK toxin-antitoxin module
MKYFFSLLILLFTITTFGQNQTNENGRKEGHWVVKGSDVDKKGYDANATYEEGSYQNGRKVGLWKVYHPNGKLKSEITFVSGRPKGPYTTYFSNGQIEEKGNWSLVKNYGKFVRYYEDGTIHQEFEFNESGKRTGTQKYYHPNGKLAIEGNWNGGKESGEVKEYYETGELRVVRTFNDGTHDESKTQHFESKSTVQPKVKEPEPIKDENNKVVKAVAADEAQLEANLGNFEGNGQYTLYNTNKQIAQKGKFKDGILYNGRSYIYSKDGILKRIEVFQNGKYIGNAPLDDR